MTLRERYPSIPYVAPFAAFMLLLAVGPKLPVDARTEAIVRVTLLAALLALVSRREITFRAPHWVASIAIGIGVFAIWIGPDVLLPGWRESAFFTNGFTARVEGPFSAAARSDPVVLVLRVARAVLLVPVIEELFWRGWLPRWVDRIDDFRSVPLGQFSRVSFVLTAVLFASEHGTLWDVGLVAGIVYNWWMHRTRSLGDLILTHAVTNACLSAYVVLRGRWEYW